MIKTASVNNSNIIHCSPDISSIVERKLSLFQDVIQKTIINAQKNKILDILGVSDMTTCVHTATNIFNKMKTIRESMTTTMYSKDNAIHDLQMLNNDVSALIKNYGTESFEDVVTVCFGPTNMDSIITDEDISKYELLKKYFHPTQYKVIQTKNIHHSNDATLITHGTEDVIMNQTKNLECMDISLVSKQFHLRVYGLKVYLHHPATNKHIIIYGIVDDAMISLMQQTYIYEKLLLIKKNIPNEECFREEGFANFIASLSLRDILLYSYTDVYSRYISYQTQYKLLKQKNLSMIVKEFMGRDLYTKRNTLIYLLITSSDYDNKYMAYLLYDLLSNDNNGTIDTVEQTILFDSFPWSIKQYFRDAIKNTVQYTNSLYNFDNNKIPLEQQICLMKTSDTVKEKAMIKLKEVKSKSEDSGSKARQYLDGLLKIPFQIYKKEPIMDVMNMNRHYMTETMSIPQVTAWLPDHQKKNSYTSIEMLHYVKEIHNKIMTPSIKIELLGKMKAYLKCHNKSRLQSIAIAINRIIDKNSMQYEVLSYQGKTKTDLLSIMNSFFESCGNNDIYSILSEIDLGVNVQFLSNINQIKMNFQKISTYMNSVKDTLDGAVYGHEKAKTQIERIIGQWINGEQDGYCFGFEGPPGVGKTSLAKHGLSKCLMDENGEFRPFAMIQMGGDSNGSTLHGHNYTYVGSTWGSIVQILIDKKCMNPIIFIDELDKISKTEHGREIIGILTHLLDPTQNDSFQDKYFSGVDIDLSKALFILSYNDVDSIDKILLDRIHRIKFSNLSLEDKLIITKKHILPDIYKKMGLQDIIYMDDTVITFIIDKYTSESGVRKLKEIIFEIVGEINIDILKNDCDQFPIHITIHDIETKYFKDKHEIKIKTIHTIGSVGTINGLWANAIGKGGIIPIQARFYPCDTFLQLKLTGMQGDVMKESMNVALTLAWGLTSLENQTRIRDLYEGNKHGIHIHCPEGSVPKDGPSAGAAITTVIYSLLNSKKIKNEIAMTGEISLDGEITEIGGLDMKFLGGIKAGVKLFMYPDENKRDFTNFMEKYKDTPLVEGILFHPVKTIQDVFTLIFEDELPQ